MNASADIIRSTAGRHLEAARRQGLSVATITAGDLVTELKIKNGTPAVCQVLSGKKLQKEFHVVLVHSEGPPSGQSTTMKYIYRLAGEETPTPKRKTLLDMQGAWKEMYDAEGGVEAVIAEMMAARRSDRD